MKYKEINIWEDSNKATLQCYILNKLTESNLRKKRPAVIICPGGGYLMTASREAEPVAMKFSSYGYNAFVLKYNTYFRNLELRPTELKDIKPENINSDSVYPQPIFDLAMTIKIIRENADEWGIDTNRIVLCGFSAGGNLVGNFAVKWQEDFLSKKVKTSKDNLKPNAVILGYPITDYLIMEKEIEKNSNGNLEEFWNTSNKAIFGKSHPSNEERKNLSPSQLVSSDTPPMFIWHTANDNLVYSINSIMLAKALYENKIPYELHIFEKGPHGLSLCDETSAGKEEHINKRCQKWFNMALYFLEEQF